MTCKVAWFCRTIPARRFRPPGRAADRQRRAQDRVPANRLKRPEYLQRLHDRPAASPILCRIVFQYARALQQAPCFFRRSGRLVCCFALPFIILFERPYFKRAALINTRRFSEPGVSHSRAGGAALRPLEHFSVRLPKEQARRQYAQYGEREATQGKPLKNALALSCPSGQELHQEGNRAGGGAFFLAAFIGDAGNIEVRPGIAARKPRQKTRGGDAARRPAAGI